MSESMENAIARVRIESIEAEQKRVMHTLQLMTAALLTAQKEIVELRARVEKIEGGEMNHVDNRGTWNILSLCSGIGGLDLGVGLAVANARTVCCVEREAYCCEVLAARMETKALDACPVWSDLRTFDGRPWRGVVDCITGGYPCQPFSFAGSRRGADDPRHLWPHIARIIGEVEPGMCFFENVGGHLSLGFESVACELQAMGYRVAAGLFTASEVGAPHKRERLFIMADSDRQHDWRPSPSRSRPSGGPASRSGEKMADTLHNQQEKQGKQRQRGSGPARSSGELFPPGPDDPAWEGIVESDPTLEPAICRVAHGDAAQLDRVERLRALGNSVVPIQAANAFVSLYASLEEGR